VDSTNVGPPLPARPAVLYLDRVDLCGLLHSTQVTALGTNPGEQLPVDGQPGRFDCLWTNFPGGTPDNAWIAGAVLGRGAETFLTATTPIVQLSGFAAVQTASGIGDHDDNCQLYVDVAPGQALEVQYDNERHDYPGMNHQRACQLAGHAAGWMVDNLRADAG
jgi:hypothetical protein